jgi:hypothetical protein
MYLYIAANYVMESGKLKDDIESMNIMRRTKHVNEISQNMRDLWEWYGLDVMTAVSRRDWKWSKRSAQLNMLFTECVTEGDEAMAIQILDLRGEMFLAQAKLKKRGKHWI